MDSPAESYDPERKRCLKQSSVEAPVRVTQGHTITGNAPRYHWYLNKSLRLSLDHLLSLRRSWLCTPSGSPADAGDAAAGLFTPRIDIRGTRLTRSTGPNRFGQGQYTIPHRPTPGSTWNRGEKKKTRHLGNSPKHRVSWGSKVGQVERQMLKSDSCIYLSADQSAAVPGQPKNFSPKCRDSHSDSTSPHPGRQTAFLRQ